MIKKAVILCGGNGTRFLPITKVFPKEMLPIINRPVLEYLLKECREAGINDVLIIINERKDMIKKYFAKDEFFDKLIGEQDFKDMNISFIYQGKKKGTGGALLDAKTFANGEDIAVLFGDDYFVGGALSELIEVYNEHNKDVLGAKECLTDDITKYGVMVGTMIDDKVMSCMGIKEKPSLDNLPSRLYFAGRTILKGDIFSRLERIGCVDGEYRLTDALTNFMAVNLASQRYDLGSKQGYIKAMIYHGLNSEWHDEIKEFIEQLLDNE
jgi:UTP--glucose-1-phosphate uridylyltransferase